MIKHHKRSRGAILALCAMSSLAWLLGACGRPPPAPQQGPCGGPASAGATSFGLPAVFVAQPGSSGGARQLIVRFKPTLGAQAFGATLSVGSVRLVHQRALAASGTQVYVLPNGADMKRVLAELRTRPEVEYAEPDARVTIQKTPNDSLYSYQWDMGAINMPKVWDVTTGSSTTVVAVLDTGILYDAAQTSRRHPDLVGKVLPGYDFVTDPEVARDGDGRDANPFDPGHDEPSGNSSYHGTHVAGTVAAATNNTRGVAGVNWNAKVLPLRVLGKCGGLISDVADAMYWAVGQDIAGVPTNPTPATVINMSFGVELSPCPATLQRAINAAVAHGAVVVAAAGNSGVDAQAMTPANCQGVIAVGASTRDGRRAYYSNYGARVDLMAPGGDSTQSGGIANLWGDDTYPSTDPRFYTYAALSGTSMAAPHVAGVVALLREQEPGLTPAQVLERLKSTATPLTAAQCGRDSGSACGAGLINAAKALGLGP